MLDQPFVLQHGNVGKGGCAADRVPTKCAQMFAWQKAIGDNLWCDKGTEWEAVSDALCHGYHIRLDPLVVIYAEEFAGAPEAGLDLVYNQQDAVTVEYLLDAYEVSLWQWDESAFSKYRLNYKCSHVPARLVADHVLYCIRAGQSAGIGLQLQRTAIAVGGRRKCDT